MAITEDGPLRADRPARDGETGSEIADQRISQHLHRSVVTRPVVPAIGRPSATRRYQRVRRNWAKLNSRAERALMDRLPGAYTEATLPVSNSSSV